MSPLLSKIRTQWPALWDRTGSTMYVGIQAATDTASAVLLTVLLAHFFSPETFGEYTYLITLAGILSVVLMLGMKMAILRAAARGGRQMLLLGTRYQLRFLPLFLLLFIGAVLFLKGSLFTPLVVFVGLAAAFFHLADNYLFLLAGEERFREGAVRKLVVNTGLLLSVVLAAYVTRNAVQSTFFYFLIPALLHGWFFIRESRAVPPATSQESSGYLALGRQLSFVGVLGVAGLYFDRLVVGSVLGLAPLAFYSIAYAYGSQLSSAAKVLAVVALPDSARLTPAATAHALRRYLPLLVAGIVGLALLMMLLASPLIHLLFPGAYTESIRFAQILPIIIIPKALGTFFARIVEVQGNPRAIYQVNLVGYLVELLFIAVLTPLYGLTGLIVAKGIAYVVYFGVALFAVLVDPLRSGGRSSSL